MALLDSTDVDYVSDPDTAARLYLELQEQLHNPGLPEGKRRATQAAINKLLRTWPEADDRAATASDDDLGGLSPRLKRRRDAHRQAKGVSAKDAANARTRRRRAEQRPPASPRKQVKPPSPSSGKAKGKPSLGGPVFGSRQADRAFQQTGVPGAARDTGRLIMQTLGLLLGLSLLYLLLTRVSAAESIVRGVSNVVALLVAPVNPFDSGQRADVLAKQPAAAQPATAPPAPAPADIAPGASIPERRTGPTVPRVRRPSSIPAHP